MPPKSYRSMPSENSVDRRSFMKLGGAAGAGLIMAGRSLLAAQQQQTTPAVKPAAPAKPKTNIEDALKVPRTKWSLPGPFPGRVIEVADEKAMPDGKPDAAELLSIVPSGLI